MVDAGPAGAEYLTIIGKQSCFRVASFDERAAVEAAIRTFQARQRGQSKGGNPEAARAKIKFDRQIVAIATVEGATAVYSDDADVVAYAREADIEAYRLSDLPEPPEDPQTALPFDCRASCPACRRSRRSDQALKARGFPVLRYSLRTRQGGNLGR